MEEIPMYFLFQSTNLETANNAKKSERPSFDAVKYMQQKGYSTSKGLKIPKNQYLPFLEQ